jgi:hypothetical protein
MCFYGCDSSNEKMRLERINAIAELNGIESQIKWLVENASPERDTAADRIYLKKVFAQIMEINSISEDSFLIAKSQRLIEDREMVFKTYYRKANDIVGSGTITSIADGLDLVNVNLWNSVKPNREIVGSLTNGDRVSILANNGEYYLVFSKSKNIRGYLMKGFVINVKYD